MKNNYLVLTVILVILSLVGAIFLVKNKPQPEPQIITEEILPTNIPTVIVEPTIASSSPTIKLSPTFKPSTIPTLISDKLKSEISSTPTPTPAFQTFSSDTEKFSVTYASNRKMYQDKEGTGNRYTFYSSSGNIAVHVGANWAWTYPERQFSQTLVVAGLPTFVYDISTQKIVDLETNGQKYTIQCVHNGSATLKTECDEFIKNFKLL